MSDNELNEVKKAKRPYVAPESMRKYQMSKKELKALRAGHHGQVAELEAKIAELKQAGMTAMPTCHQSRLNEVNFQIKMIDALL